MWINQLKYPGHLTETSRALVINKLPLKSASNPSSLPTAKPLVEQAQQKYTRTQRDQLVWQAQYTHARCCSLLRHLHTFRPTNSPLQNDHLCNTEQPFSTELKPISLKEQPAYTRQLIQALVETADDLFWVPERYPKKQYLLLIKRSDQLCYAFDQFHRHSTSTGKGIMRLTLVSSTCALLKLLLQEHLEVSAPEWL